VIKIRCDESGFARIKEALINYNPCLKWVVYKNTPD